MAGVYSATTAPNPKSSWFMVPSENLDKIRCGIKVIEVLLSFVAFITEEVVNSCISCTALYFFEFVSCTAFLFTLLLLILLSTTLHTRVGISCWPSLDFGYTVFIFVLFFIASSVFASDNSGTVTEKFAVVFGFLATVMFVIDLILFVRNRGLPFKKDGKPEPSNGGPPMVEAGALETAKLNTPANETD
ncbi:CKLF-like MARVEL transmembrane domain-containing protein 6 [Sebastes umbrosus]|uniref:CKLF-like MARVEL transmembrane domain-containing protein 6 n=1 Tax=Sebastes umbrosus TaxID=72105 RepID=UPI0018A041CE|nr:CKLF-like MARVEL transmembrane domain-containing protein 6 [Sebastes umbrosus]XP_037639644.1 CKLF-like MARVEL transmembrane domain-containing protein 6 [Sebastes umbrosus]